jgi:hypothetical protein
MSTKPCRFSFVFDPSAHDFFVLDFCCLPVDILKTILLPPLRGLLRYIRISSSGLQRSVQNVLMHPVFQGVVEMPVVYIDAPPGIRADAKRKMMEKITSAIDEAYHIGDTLVFLREHAIDNVAMDGRIQSDNPKILESLKKIGG